MPLSPGEILQNRYRIDQLLGQGGFGAVYKAWDLNLNRACAIKENLETSPEAQRQFYREATLLAGLDHPNLARVLDYFIVNGQGQYLVMNFVQGQDLQSMMDDAGGPLPLDQVLNWAGQICDALEYLHNQPNPIIHRDIKPANIRITAANRAILVDFGIAKMWDPVKRTTVGAQAVTPGFSPFEQYGQHGQAPTDARSDIYALAATAYALLTGKAPPESIARIAGIPLPPPRQFNQTIPPGVETALLHAMETQPDRRFDSALAFKQALTGPPAGVYVTQMAASANPQPYHAAARQAPVPQAVPGPAAGAVTAPPARQRLARVLPWSIGALVLLAVAGLIVYMATRPEGEPPSPTAVSALQTKAPAASQAPAATQAPVEKAQLEVFSWWTGGADAAGLEAMIAIWNEKYPDIEFVNAAAAGDAGSDAQAVLTARLSAGDPPDSWQTHAGQELIGAYVSTGLIEPLDDLYEANGWYDIFPETLIRLITQDGHPYSVPVNIHRTNVLWYNPKVLEQYRVGVPTDFIGFVAALDALKAAGMEAPLSLGESWTEVDMFESILLATIGADMYTALWNGEADWAAPEVTTALENVKKLMEYVNTDHATLSWQEASKLVADGDAAFNIMGDWAEGYFYGAVDGGNLGLRPLIDYVWMPVPGTQGVYQFMTDSFVLPIGARNPEAAKKWLEFCGSKEGQDTFNPVKGSIAARNDSDKTLYNVYLQSAMDDWSRDVIVGSLLGGVVANPTWAAKIASDLGAFMIDFNVGNFQAALVASCANFGPCGK